jgi:hypothetical protein
LFVFVCFIFVSMVRQPLVTSLPSVALSLRPISRKRAVISHAVMTALRIAVDSNRLSLRPLAVSPWKPAKAIPEFRNTICCCFSYNAIAHTVSSWLSLAEPWTQHQSNPS